MGQDTKPRLRIPSDAAIQGPVPQPNPILKWIAEQGDNIVTGAETIAGFFDGNPAGEIAKAVALIPPGLARGAGYDLLEQLKREGTVPAPILKALSDAQRRYPRLFGHVEEVRNVDQQHMYGAAYPTDAAWQLGRGSGPRLATNRYLKDAPKIQRKEKDAPGVALNMRKLTSAGEDQATKTVHHELAHVAQMIRRGKKFDDEYQDASRDVGYIDNPYEVRARQSGGRASARATEERFRNQVRDAAPDMPITTPPMSTSKLRTLKLNTELKPNQRELEKTWEELTKLRAIPGNWTVAHSNQAQLLRARIRQLLQHDPVK